MKRAELKNAMARLIEAAYDGGVLPHYLDEEPNQEDFATINDQMYSVMIDLLDYIPEPAGEDE